MVAVVLLIVWGACTIKYSKEAFDKFRSGKVKGERQNCALDGHSDQPSELQKLGMNDLDVGSGSSSLVTFLSKMPTPGWAAD